MGHKTVTGLQVGPGANKGLGTPITVYFSPTSYLVDGADDVSEGVKQRYVLQGAPFLQTPLLTLRLPAVLRGPPDGVGGGRERERERERDRDRDRDRESETERETETETERETETVRQRE